MPPSPVNRREKVPRVPEHKRSVREQNTFSPSKVTDSGGIVSLFSRSLDTTKTIPSSATSGTPSRRTPTRRTSARRNIG